MDPGTIGGIIGAVLGGIGGLIGAKSSYMRCKTVKGKKLVVWFAIIGYLYFGALITAFFLMPHPHGFWVLIPNFMFIVLGIPMFNKRLAAHERERHAV